MTSRESKFKRPCPNCKEYGNHFVPPSLGEPGFFICAASTLPPGSPAGETASENRDKPWRDDYLVPEGDDRCPALYGGVQCKRWAGHDTKYHWAIGGNIEWVDGEVPLSVSACAVPEPVPAEGSNGFRAWVLDAHKYGVRFLDCGETWIGDGGSGPVIRNIALVLGLAAPIAPAAEDREQTPLGIERALRLENEASAAMVISVLEDERQDAEELIRALEDALKELQPYFEGEHHSSHPSVLILNAALARAEEYRKGAKPAAEEETLYQKQDRRTRLANELIALDREIFELTYRTLDRKGAKNEPR
jgi:hypothetical protein